VQPVLRLVAIVTALLLAGCTATAPTTAAGPAARDRLEAVIDLSDQEVVVTRSRASGARETYRWPVSTGRANHPTPTGTFRPTMLSRNHRSSLYDDAPMPWSVFFNGHIAMHGTTETHRLGRPASHGCVRLHPSHAEIFFKQVLEVGRANTRISVVR